jgi:hypothetical protein
VAAVSSDADRLLGMPGGLPAPGFVGLTEDQAVEWLRRGGGTIRVLARDGEGAARTDNYQPERVNLVIEGGRVTAPPGRSRPCKRFLCIPADASRAASVAVAAR